MTESLTKIWKQVLDGDSRAWEQLVRQYNSLIVAVARSHGLSSSDLEDCAQQTWLALYTGKKKIINPLSIPTWLVRVAKRKAQRLQIKSKSRSFAESQFDFTKLNLSPEELYNRVLDTARVHTALEMLDPRCRKLLTKLFLTNEELSYVDIARDLKLAVNSLGPIRSRCLERLRKKLEEL